MSEETAEVAERLIEEAMTVEAFVEAIGGDDPAQIVQRALDPADPAMAVVGWPGQRLAQPLARGDLIVRDRPDGAPRLSVVDEPEPMTRVEARRRALMTNGPYPGRYVRVLEPGANRGAGFARRLSGPDGLVLPGITVVRKIGEDGETLPPTTQPTIRAGSSGPAVANAQARLNAVDATRRAHGAPGLDRCPLVVDGQFGNATRAAVVAFQRTAFPGEPAQWDGVVGPRSWAALSGDPEDENPLPTRCPGLAPREVIDNFDFNSSTVLPRHQPKIVGIARCVIESERTRTPIRTQTITGHTDNVGGDTDNDALGLRRAEAVKAEILAAIRRISGAAPRLVITTETRGEHEPVGADAGANRRVEVVTPVRVTPPPPPPAAASVAFVIDDDGDHRVDAGAPAATALMFGLWDQALDGSGNIRNAAAETDNFVGLDIRRFYIRVRDPSATGATVSANWRTLTAANAADDAPASQAVTLTATATGSKVFVSKALMLVSGDTDARQPTHSGLTSGPDAGLRQRGQSNHRLRRAELDGFVEVRYAPASGSAVTQRLPVFQRSPDVRRRLSVRVVNYDNHATAADIAGHFATANRRWAQTGLRIDPGTTEARTLPAAAQDSNGDYAQQDPDDAAEVAAIADLRPGSADNTLTVVFVRMPSSNAYTTLFERTASNLEQRFFVFINPGIDPEGTTLAHELHHVLFNRPDLKPTPPVSDFAFRAFFPFNTRPSLAYGLTVPDSRVRHRVQHLHSTNPDQDPNNDNVVNWMKRRRTTRFPFPPATSATIAADSSTGNTLTRSF